MSRLDYFTVGIVGLCILAIIFLLYKVVGNVSSDTTTTPTEISVDENTADDDTATLDGDLTDDEGDLDGESNLNDEDTMNDGFTTTTADNGDGDNVDEAKERAEAMSDEVIDDAIPRQVTRSDGQPGNYMVFAGTFSIRQNADNLAKKLRKSGYENAKVELFNGGKYAVVMVDRFKFFDDAKKLSTDIKARGYESSIHRKRGNY